MFKDKGHICLSTMQYSVLFSAMLPVRTPC